jgi:hypothetical protein
MAQSGGKVESKKKLTRLTAIAAVAVVVAAIVTGVTCFVTAWSGEDWQVGNLTYHGQYPNQTQEGRWLIAVCFAAVVWAGVFLFRRNVFTALAGVALAATASGLSYWSTNVADSSLEALLNDTPPRSAHWLSVMSLAIWFGFAVAVAIGQWWIDGHARPLAIEVFGDFGFRHFLTTGITGLFWVLSIAAATVAVGGVVADTWWENSFPQALLIAPVAVVGAFFLLLLVRLTLELAVVLFRIYEEVRL